MINKVKQFCICNSFVRKAKNVTNPIGFITFIIFIFITPHAPLRISPHTRYLDSLLGPGTRVFDTFLSFKTLAGIVMPIFFCQI